VSSEIDPDTYRSSAQQAFERMSPEDRSEFARQLHEQAGGQGLPLAEPRRKLRHRPRQSRGDDNARAPAVPGLVGGLLGGAGGGNPLVKATMAGITAFAVKADDEPPLISLCGSLRPSQRRFGQRSERAPN